MWKRGFFLGGGRGGWDGGKEVYFGGLGGGGCVGKRRVFMQGTEAGSKRYVFLVMLS